MSLKTHQADMRALTEKDAAMYINMSRSFLAKGRMHGKRKNHCPPPPYVKAGKTIRYLKEDLDSWLSQLRITR